MAKQINIAHKQEKKNDEKIRDRIYENISHVLCINIDVTYSASSCPSKFIVCTF